MGMQLATNLYLCVAHIGINDYEVTVSKQVRAPSPAFANALFQTFLPELLLAEGVTINENDVVTGGVDVILEDNPHKNRNM